MKDKDAVLRMKEYMKKIGSRQGFSLSELLMAILVLSIMTVALTAGVSASLRVYRDSVRYAEERTLLSTLSEAVISELRNAKDITDTDKETFTFTSANYGPQAAFKVVSGKLTLAGRPLIGSGSYSNDTIEVDEKKTLIKHSRDDKGDLFDVSLVLSGSEESRNFKVRTLTDSDLYPSSSAVH